MTAASTIRSLPRHHATPAIQSLRSNVTRAEAIRELGRSGIAGLVYRAAVGPLQSVAEFYIPFRIFRVEIVNNGRAEVSIFGLDAVAGTLDLYHFDAIVESSQLMAVSTRNRLPAMLPDALARELVVDKVRRVLFTRGFFRMRELRIAASPLPELLHVPYWVGFYGHERRLRFSIMDAVRRRFEGGKVRQLLQNWLSETELSSQGPSLHNASRSTTAFG